MKIVSWNVNGIRAIAKRSFFTDLELLGADIVCLQVPAVENSFILEHMTGSDHCPVGIVLKL